MTVSGISVEEKVVDPRALKHQNGYFSWRGQKRFQIPYFTDKKSETKKYYYLSKLTEPKFPGFAPVLGFLKKEAHLFLKNKPLQLTSYKR